MNDNSPSMSYWQQVRLPRFSRLGRSRKFDVVVVGAGITGLTAAYLLKRAGKKVCVLDREHIGAVDTGHTTAHLTYVTDLRLGKLVKHFGKDAARLAWLGGAAAINTIEEIVGALKIGCQFTRVPGYLHASLDGQRDERSDLEKEANLACELDFDATFLESIPYVGKPGIRFSNQAKFHPLAYIAALARAVDGEGSAVFEQADVSEIKEEPFAAVVEGKEVECDYLVIATHVPLMGKTGLVNATLFQTKLAPYSSYVVGAAVPRGRIPEASFWDTSDPYYYLRVDAGKKSDYVIFGGLDHKTGQETDTPARFSDLRARLYTLVPEAEAVDHQWSGQVIETNDGLPYIGETAERQFVATGFAGNGMTFGTLAAMMACDAVLGRKNPWQSLFSVDRKKVRGGAWDYVKENLDYPYYLVRDRLAPAEGNSIRAVRRGEGKILKLDGQRVACYRDEEGKVTTASAVCTHMGCIVRWNDAERTWDCPCHGSRFHNTGEVMAGPAETSLESIQPAKKPTRKAPSGQKKKPPRRGSAGRSKDRRSAGRRSGQK
jgi:glycine/D-amino acid oxidase-like deaminating enzyme/nitrite reductase/ring-hydroxylating ferredoxin subunit